jgi:hypothetical protein
VVGVRTDWASGRGARRGAGREARGAGRGALVAGHWSRGAGHWWAGNLSCVYWCLRNAAGCLKVGNLSWP